MSIDSEPAADGAIAAGPQASPEDMLAGTAAGDARAFEGLYHLYAPRILAFLRKRTSNPAVLGDLVQEIFLAVWRKAALFKPESGGADQWIFAIARHKLYDAWRHLARLREDALDVEPGESLPGPGLPQDSALELASLVGKLEPLQRQAVQTVYYDGLTLEEGAARLRTPVGTLKSRLHKALKRLRILIIAGETA